jgi:hypothetical protein
MFLFCSKMRDHVERGCVELRKRKLVHLTRGDSLAVFTHYSIGLDDREWLEAHAADGELPHAVNIDDPRRLRYLAWQKRRHPWEQLVLQQLRSGELVSTGYQLPIAIDAKRQTISRHLWDFLEPDFRQSTAQGEGIKIVRIEVMEAPLPGSVPYVPRVDRTSEQLVELTDDNMALTINGERFLFRGSGHRRLIRRLYDAYKAGSPELTQVLTRKSGVAQGSIAQAFRGYPQWARLRLHIRTENGFCFLEPKFR